MGEEVDEMKITLRDGLKMLFDTKKWADCSFHFATDGLNEIKAHKLILATASPVFRAMFYGEMATNLPVETEDIRPEVCKLMLEYIYTDKCTVPDSDELYDLYYAAEKYMLPMLKKRCVEEIMECLNASNACKNYEFAKLFNIPALTRRTKMMILLTETSAVLASESIEDVQFSTLLMIVDYEELNVSSEVELFDAVMRWGRKQGKRRNNESLRHLLDPLLKKINFLTLTANEFLEGPAESKILTDSESLHIVRNIIGRSANFPMLKGFSVQTEHRRADLCDLLFPDEYEMTELEPKVDACNDWPEGLEMRFKYLLQSEQFSDCSFAFVDEVNDTPRLYKAHWLILSMISPKFRDLWSWNKESDISSQTENDESAEEKDNEPSKLDHKEDSESCGEEEGGEISETVKEQPVQTEDGKPGSGKVDDEPVQKEDDETRRTEREQPVQKEDGEFCGKGDVGPVQKDDGESSDKGNNEHIKIVGMSPNTFKCLLDFIYTDKCNLPDSDEIYEMAEAAYTYCLPLLVDKCVSKMIPIRNTFNAMKTFQTLFYVNARSEYLNNARAFIFSHTSAILKEPSFVDIDFKFLVTLLSADEIKISSEMELFEAAMRWARKECQRRVLPEDDKNLRTVIDPALKNIRFLSLTAEVFAEGPALSDILTESERFHILVNIVNPNTKLPMPEGFSTRKK